MAGSWAPAAKVWDVGTGKLAVELKGMTFEPQRRLSARTVHGLSFVGEG